MMRWGGWFVLAGLACGGDAGRDSDEEAKVIPETLQFNSDVCEGDPQVLMLIDSGKAGYTDCRGDTICGEFTIEEGVATAVFGELGPPEQVVPLEGSGRWSLQDEVDGSVGAARCR